MKDYSKGLIYTIKTNDGLYVGSTVEFEKRKLSHQYHIYNENHKEYNYKLYKNIRANDGDYRIEIYKLFPCDNKRELEKEETRVMLEMNANLNVKLSYTTAEEKRKTHKEIQKKYYQKNKEYYKEYRKEYYNEIITCECGCDTGRGNMTRHRKTKRHLNRMKVLDSIFT